MLWSLVKVRKYQCFFQSWFSRGEGKGQLEWVVKLVCTVLERTQRVRFRFCPTARITCPTSYPDRKWRLPFQPLSDNSCIDVTSYGCLRKSKIRPYMSYINLISRKNSIKATRLVSFLIGWMGEKMHTSKGSCPKSVQCTHACTWSVSYPKWRLPFWDNLSDDLSDRLSDK